jgi:N-acyl-D-amino-acid deacylase
MDLDALDHTGHPELTVTYPKGIPYVLVNGEVVVDNGAHNGVRPGFILRRM